jgi:CRP/FNR family cyclic AMP-dependent transcriptional regulator
VSEDEAEAPSRARRQPSARRHIGSPRAAQQGPAGREFFVLVEGTVAVGRGERKLADLGPGDWFGEIAILTYKPRTATVTATSPVRLLVMDDRAFRRVVETTPRIALKVLRNVAHRLEHDALS